MKVLISETRSTNQIKIVFPVDLLGAPNERVCWVANADLLFHDRSLSIRIYRKPFQIQKLSLIYEAEKQARAGLRKAAYKIRRTLGTKVHHHLLVPDLGDKVPAGEYDFQKEVLKEENGEVLDMVVKIELSSALDVKEVRSLLGFNRFNLVYGV